uniref:Uncharacterized protein n=1 Tax=Anguilla anguilla TaxID=7936 RepID=A0A0E9WYH4_ANGAN
MAIGFLPNLFSLFPLMCWKFPLRIRNTGDTVRCYSEVLTAGTFETTGSVGAILSARTDKTLVVIHTTSSVLRRPIARETIAGVRAR